MFSPVFTGFSDFLGASLVLAELIPRHSVFAGTAVKDGAFEEINLKQYIGKWTLLVFYPMVSTALLVLAGQGSRRIRTSLVSIQPARSRPLSEAPSRLPHRDPRFQQGPARV